MKETKNAKMIQRKKLIRKFDDSEFNASLFSFVLFVAEYRFLNHKM